VEDGRLGSPPARPGKAGGYLPDGRGEAPISANLRSRGGGWVSPPWAPWAGVGWERGEAKEGGAAV
jgi:hypothetical protein